VDIEKFKQSYTRLNPAQKEAVDTIEGPVMVIAGPGTGKTQILTLRIANIVRQTDTEPENILALTFTEAGVTSMRKRLSEMMGSQAYAVSINTFHGFSNNIIKNYPECFPRIIGSDAVTDSERVKIFEEVIEELPLKKLRPFGDKFNYLYDMMSAISDLKREGVDTENFREIVAEDRKNFSSIEDLYYVSGRYEGRMKGKYADEDKNITKNEELCAIYEAYENKLSEKKLYDYEDMIMETLKALRINEDLLLSLQEKYQYMLVDEHQDSNKAQNRILELLANFHDNPNIFVVGDEKQAIFRFQGASLDNFYYFKNIYPQAKLITLEENYRSTQEILDSAHSLLPGEKELRSNTDKGKKISVYPFVNAQAEEYFIAEDIKRRIDEGEDPGNITVLFRENKDGIPIAAALSKYGVPHVLESDDNLFTDNDVRKLVTIMKAAAYPEDQFSLVQAMHMSCFGIQPFDIYKILDAARKERVHVADIIRDSEKMTEAGIKDPSAAEDFYKKISDYKTISKNDGLMESVEAIITGSGMIKEVMGSSEAMTRLAKINAFFNHVRDFSEKKRVATFDDFMSHMETMESHGISMSSGKPSHSSGKVRLMTAHRSKGQEFPTVYIVKVIDGHWGNKRRPRKIRLPGGVYSLSGRVIEENEKLDDERKLFYVAVTRAKKEIIITLHKESGDGKELLPAVFLEEINEDRLEYEDTEKWDKGITAHIQNMFSAPKHSDPEEEIKKLTKETFESKGLSATDINNYMECPWKYFYNGLFRIPEAEARHLIYGTAIHAALKDLFESIKERGADKEFLISKFKYHLLKKPLKDSDREELLKKGEVALSTYFDQRVSEWDKDYLTEFNIAGVELTPETMIKGRIDRMEILGFSNDVNVTDFKTGRAKSEKEVAGETKNSNGNIKRQLVFYKLLLDGYKDGKYKMVSADIDFIEPDEKGECRRHNFSVTDEEARELKAEVIRIADEIRDLTFWNRRCDDPDCPYCKLRDGMGG
jgi:DNA helicase-2/ATP-dependent DNA helicase PcrA